MHPDEVSVHDMKQALDDLQRASDAVAEQLYKGAQSASGPQGAQGSSGGAGVKDGEVVDAEYAETR